uniref:Secreted protein n=1 Tax=Angiostrongylus cantonensis TaxID=6313 RepID=A0A0K0D454_ANGCA
MDQRDEFMAIAATSLLVLFYRSSLVSACGPAPGQQMTNRTFVVTGFNLPTRLAYSAEAGVRAQVPFLSTSEQAARALVQNLVNDSIREVLEENGRRARLPDFVTSAILDQIQMQINYQPLRCAAVLVDAMPAAMLNPAAGNMRESCFVVGDIVSAICPLDNNNMVQNCQLVGGIQAIAVPSQHLTITGTIVIRNIVLSTWTTQQWQSVLNRVLRLLTSRLGTAFSSATVTVT